MTAALALSCQGNVNINNQNTICNDGSGDCSATNAQTQTERTSIGVGDGAVDAVFDDDDDTEAGPEDADPEPTITIGLPFVGGINLLRLPVDGTIDLTITNTTDAPIRAETTTRLRVGPSFNNVSHGNTDLAPFASAVVQVPVDAIGMTFDLEPDTAPAVLDPVIELFDLSGAPIGPRDSKRELVRSRNRRGRRISV